MQDSEALFAVWLIFRLLFIGLIYLFILSGLDDLFVDLVFYGRWLFRKLFRRKVIHPVTLDQLAAVSQKPIAIMIPAWDESSVVCRMLMNTMGTLDYRNYHIFVGTYPNDEATRLEVEKAREVYPNIDAIVTPAPGPTNKADCLNWIVQGIRVYERDHNVRFDIFVLHDSEDVVHPLSLKFYNYLIPRVHFIQLPVFPFETELRNLVTGVYLDEFAENHTKELRVRELVAGALPSAGVGTAISREAMDYLAARNQNQIFDIRTLTEDYLMGVKLNNFKGHKIFLQQAVPVHAPTGKRSAARRSSVAIATREFFPTTFSAAVRQKSRWILGIALQGWSAGWTRSLGQNYFLFRDRKSVVTNLGVVLGYVVVAYSLVHALLRRHVMPDLPPLLEADEFHYRLIPFVFAMFCWRAINRIGSSWHVYGFRQGLMALPRLLFGNVLNFSATVMAIRRYISARMSGKTPEWGKTAHAFPSEEQMRGYHRRLGDLLMENHFVTAAQLQEALRVQKETRKRLGDILIEMGALWEEDLVRALAQQRSRASVEIDPNDTPREVLALVPREVAEQYRIFPVALHGETLVVAADPADTDRRREDLSVLLNRPVEVRWCAATDLDFALRRGYAPPASTVRPADRRLGNILRAEGRISDKDLLQARRRQKRSNRPLGEVLVEMGVVTAGDVKLALERQSS